jgi:hypothetical protein
VTKPRRGTRHPRALAKPATAGVPTSLSTRDALAALAVDAECWSAICRQVRLGLADVARARAFHAHPLAVALRDEERKIIAEVATRDWRSEHPAVLLGALFVSQLLVHACETGVLPDTVPGDRFEALLVRLIQVSAEARQDPLALARLALLALHSSEETKRELGRRLRDHHGAHAAVVALLGDRAPDVAQCALNRLVKTALHHVGPGWRATHGQDGRDDLVGAVGEQVALRHRGRTDPAGRLAAWLEALPPGPATSAWDYVSRDAAKRERRAAGAKFRRADAVHPQREDDLSGSPDDTGPRGQADPAAPEREALAHIGFVEFLDAVRAEPKLVAALDAGLTEEDRTTVAARLDLTTRTVQNYLTRLRALAERHV